MHRKYGIFGASLLHLTDFSEGSLTAYMHALRIAVAVNGPLDVLHIQHGDAESNWQQYPVVRETLGNWGGLPHDSDAGDPDHPGVHITRSVSQARSTIDGVVSHLKRRDADLIVMATHRRAGLDRWLHEGIAEALSREAEAGALFIPYDVDGFVSPATGDVCLSRILIPIDRRPDPQPVVDAVVDLVEAIAPADVEVRLLHVGDQDRIPSPTLPGTDRCVWNWIQREGDVVDTICKEAEAGDVDLIAMTTNGHDGFLDILRGSTTERVLHRAGCPVLAIHAADI